MTIIPEQRGVVDRGRSFGGPTVAANQTPTNSRIRHIISRHDQQGDVGVSPCLAYRSLPSTSGGQMLRLSLVVALLGIASSAWAGPVPLTGEALRQELVGSLLAIDTPLVGVVIPVRVSADGLVSGEAGPLASTLGAAHDRGRWWIDNDRLCVKWFRWFEAQTRCITVEHEGTKIYWKEESGESGTATITKGSPERAKVIPPSIEANQPSIPSTNPSPSSEASVVVASVPAPPDSVEQMRFAAVDLVAGLLPASTVEPEPNKLGVGTSDPPKP